MKSKPILQMHWLKAIVLLLSACVLALPGHAQSAATGTVRGRVYNPVTQTYVRNAEVRVEGTNLSATTEGDGSFVLVNVPPGPVTVTAEFSGYQATRDSFTVSGGQTVVREIELGRMTAGKAADDVLQLDVFTVAAEREGNAKAIMQQKQSMNITMSVGAEVFGDNADGNVGEFLKFLPGVDVDYTDMQARGPRIGGMDPQYAGVAFDGVRIATADANRTGDLGRSPGFDSFSITAIESIEVTRTSTPDMDGDTPAGNVNIRTRRAFDRKGRRISYNFTLAMNSEDFNLKNTYGPAGKRTYKAKPNLTLEYSDSYFGNTFGVVLGYNRVGTYSANIQNAITYNRTTTPTDSRPMVATSFIFKENPFVLQKETYLMSTDWKTPIPNLIISSTLNYSATLGQFYNRAVTLNAGNRATILGDGVTEIRTAASGATINNSTEPQGSKFTNSVTFSPKFEYKRGRITLDGNLVYSRSFNQYDALEQGHIRIDSTDNLATQFVATRSDLNSTEWTLQQVGGADWFNLTSYKNPRIGNEGRRSKSIIQGGALNARWLTPLKRFPTDIKIGGKISHEGRYSGNETNVNQWSYIGPGGNILTGFNPTTGAPLITGSGSFPGNMVNPFFFSTGRTNIATFVDSAGQYRPQGIPRVDTTAMAQLFRTNPEYFVNNSTAVDYFAANVSAKRHVEQVVTSWYGMVTTRLTRKLQVQGGVRWEETESTSLEFDPKTNREMAAAGFPVNAQGRATTIPGINYQYLSTPRIEHTVSYIRPFPSITAKYSFSPNLQLHGGFNQAISRPPFDQLAGPWIINEDTLVITAPNPNLKPEESKNYSLRAAYYFEPAGQLSVTLTENKITNLRQTRRGTAEEFGVADDPQYANYEFQSPYNVDGERLNRNLEFGYSQTLPFKHELLRGITLNVSYTRSYANARRANLVPHRIATNVAYAYRKFRGRVGIVWRDDTPEATEGRYRRHDTKIDVQGEYQLHRHASAFFQARDLTAVGTTQMETPLGMKEGQMAHIRQYSNFGVAWNFGVKGTF